MLLSTSNTEIAFQAQSDASLKRSYWIFRLIAHPWLVRIGSGLLRAALSLRLPVEGLVKATLFRQFCGGESLEQCVPVIDSLGKFNVGTILDYAAEASQNERAYDANFQEFERAIAFATRDKRIHFCVVKCTALVRFELLEAVQSKAPLTAEEQAEWVRAKARIENLCQQAHASSIRLFMDAEESWIQGTIDTLATQMMEKFNRDWACVFNTLQMYRGDRMEFLRRSFEDAVAGKYLLGLKLVRGAYMEKERARAQEKGYPSPILPTKAATDAAYDDALRFSLDHLDRIVLCAGTHNEASTIALTGWMQSQAITKGDTRVTFSQLYGMSNHLTFNLAAEGYVVSKYVPYGPVKLVVPYLLRRADENTAVAGQTSRELTLIQQEIERRRRASYNG